jgi:segregation and condensation protein B
MARKKIDLRNVSLAEGETAGSPPAPAEETEAAVETAEAAETEELEEKEAKPPVEEPDGEDTDEASAEEAESAPERDPGTLAAIIEALLFAAGEPLSAAQLSRAIGGTSAPAVRDAIQSLREQYSQTQRSFEIADIAGGHQLLTRQEFAPFIRKLKKQRDLTKLTPASVETLAIIAYNPRITRAEIENIRGVGCGPILRALTERKLIRTAGRSEKLGSPLMYETTSRFLEQFGLSSLKDMPRIGEFTPLTAPSAPETDVGETPVDTESAAAEASPPPPESEPEPGESDPD